MKKDLVICECNSTEHQFIFLYDEDPDKNGNIDRTVYIHTHLCKLPFFQRLKNGIKYIFGYQCRYGAFDEFIINPKDVDKFENVVRFLREDIDNKELNDDMDAEVDSYFSEKENE